MASQSSLRFIQIPNENELRVIVGEQKDFVVIKLTKGKAEIFGTEMQIDQPYRFPSGSSFSVFTWNDQGCEVKLVGNVKAFKVSQNNQHMILNTILHASLEESRCIADEHDTFKNGPRILVVGPKDVGKSTLCRFLLNYAVRMGRQPLYIDLDVGQSSLSIPGTMGVATINTPADIVSGFDNRTAQVFQFGYKSPGHCFGFYLTMLSRLGQVMKSSLQTASKNMISSGVVINSCGMGGNEGYKAITHAAKVFEIDTLCVIGEETLHSQLKKEVSASVDVIYMPRLKGVMERSWQMRIKTRDTRFREYFYGINNNLNPFTFDVNYAGVQVVQASLKNDKIQIARAPLGMLRNRVLALSSAETLSGDIFLNHVIGFICVTQVDLARQTMTVLSPQPSPLPKNILIMGGGFLVSEGLIANFGREERGRGPEPPSRKKNKGKNKRRGGFSINNINII